ncbi:MAG: VWA domain-containing protein [Terriglobales bacterium]
MILRKETGKRRLALLLGAVLLVVPAMWAQGQKSSAPPDQQNVPDAPSATRPAQTFPSVPPSPENAPPPAPDIQQVPPGGATPVPGSDRDQLFTLTKNVNFVVVPVTVKDSAGHLVEGLTRRDFKVLEENAEQRMTFFTSDPFPLSAAVVLDLGVPDMVFRKVRETLPALVGAFGQFDEVSLFTFATTVQEVQEFVPAEGNKLSASMDRIRKTRSGRTGGVPVAGGPFGSPASPSVNGRPLDPGGRTIPTINDREPKVLNDAVLTAALTLAKRDPTRRKVLFIISDGTEYRSDASFASVLKVLLTNQITVYAVGVGNAALPAYGKAQHARIPGMGYGDILPKYASSTGGEVFDEFDSNAIEQAYSRVTEEARNQYTIGYTTRATPSSTYRDIEVKVLRPGLVVKARQGYYPLPPPRAQ